MSGAAKCAEYLLPYITNGKQMCHTLIIAPAECGKMTLLKELIHLIFNGNEYIKGSTVGMVEECSKADGIIMLIRSKTPQVIAVDEIEKPEEIRALEYAIHCGCKLLVGVQGNSIEEIMKKPIFGQLIKERRFERYVVLNDETESEKVGNIYDERGVCIR